MSTVKATDSLWLSVSCNLADWILSSECQYSGCPPWPCSWNLPLNTPCEELPTHCSLHVLHALTTVYSENICTYVTLSNSTWMTMMPQNTHSPITLWQFQHWCRYCWLVFRNQLHHWNSLATKTSLQDTPLLSHLLSQDKYQVLYSSCQELSSGQFQESTSNCAMGTQHMAMLPRQGLQYPQDEGVHLNRMNTRQKFKTLFLPNDLIHCFEILVQEYNDKSLENKCRKATCKRLWEVPLFFKIM